MNPKQRLHAVIAQLKCDARNAVMASLDRDGISWELALALQRGGDETVSVEIVCGTVVVKPWVHRDDGIAEQCRGDDLQALRKACVALGFEYKIS